MNVEADDAGRLRAFRQRFGRGWDALTNVEEEELEEGDEGGKEGGKGGQEDSLMDLISGFAQEAEKQGKPAVVRENKEKSGKGKSGER